jgi:naphtho-gamma-pyrone polyketide synthase
VTLLSLHRRKDGWNVLTASLSSLYLAGFELQWDEYHRDFEAAQEVLQLPAYRWDNKNYWIQYEHNWTLTKGDAPSVGGPSRLTLPKFSTISIQSIIEEHHDKSSATVVMESDFSHPLLKSVAHGHKVNGVALCPSVSAENKPLSNIMLPLTSIQSLYADVAQTLGSYLAENYQPDIKHSGIDVCDMMALKPLIVKDEGRQLFRASMKADWITKSAVFKLFSVNLEGKVISEHANCAIRFSDCDIWEREWERNSYLIRRSIQMLQAGVDEGQNHRIRTGMAYKLFASLVEYDQNYKAMQEVIIDSGQYEATAIVRFQAEESNFHRNPFWIDSLGHLTGFVMNANDRTPKDMVYVNHGWKSMKCLKKFSADTQYRTYVKMQLVGDNVYAGDLYVLEADKVIALYEGVKVMSPGYYLEETS